MTGKTQSEAVTILRNTKLGTDVNLVVSRQVEALSLDDSKNLPREIVSTVQLCVHLAMYDLYTVWSYIEVVILL